MPASTRVKICGLRSAETIAAAAEAGAAYIGFNFFARSPRSVTPAEAAALAVDVPMGVAKVGLVVGGTDAELDAIINTVPLDMIQLHGGETVERAAAIRARYGLPIIKVIGVSEQADLAAVDEFAEVSDQFLIDAKAPKGAVLPGGNGLTFDWRLVAGRRWPIPWMLAGGLTPENVAEAIARTGASQVDVASGVESAAGVKDPAKMAAFVAAAQG